MSVPGRAWAILALLAALGSVVAGWWPSTWIDWQPDLASSQPWRAVTAAFVHWSGLHLAANLAGAAVVAAFGWAARVPLSMTLAWGLAWPLTHLGLLLRPELAHYGGLSGVLHAGTVVSVLWLVAGARTELPRGAGWIGSGVGLALLLKLWLEAPWGPVLRHGDGWDIAIAPLAHASGALAGALCAAVALVAQRVLQRRQPPPQSTG